MIRSCFQHLYSLDRHRIVTADNVRLRFNRGERPIPHPPELVEAMRLAETDVRQYPSYPAFYERLAAFAGVPVARLTVGAGIEEFIRTLTFLCCDPGQRLSVLWPTCAMYEIYAKAFGVGLLKIVTDPDRQINLGDVMIHAGGEVPITFLPNPGQPVETCFSVSELRQVARSCANYGTVLAIDEAHHGFGAPTALPLVDEFENVVVLRTFSKAMGAAGIRAGYAVAQEKLTKALHAVRPSGEITGPSMAVATMLMDRFDDCVAPAIAATIEGRDWARAAINGIPGMKASGRYGFSLLIDCGEQERATDIGNRLASQGIYVKANFEPPVHRHMLAACGSKAMMQEFVSALREVCQ